MQKIIFLDKNDAEVLAPDASETERVEVAVRWINRKVQSTVHFGLVQIGYYLLNNFFGGSIEEALSRNPHKQHSFRSLCKHPELVISSTHLINAVKLVVQEKQLADHKSFQALPVSHKIALLGTRDLEARRGLAQRATDEGLSVRALTREVRKVRGETAVADADRWSRRLRRALDLVIETTELPMDGISPQEAAALDRAICEARRRLQTTLASVRGIRSVAV